MICIIYRKTTGHVLNILESETFPKGFCEANTPPDCSHITMPNSALPIGERHRAWSVMDGRLVAIAVAGLTEEQLKKVFSKHTQEILDSVAQTWGYDDIRSAVSYVGDPHPRFAAEGEALRNWRSEVWASFEVISTQPLSTIEERISRLPAPPARPLPSI